MMINGGVVLVATREEAAFAPRCHLDLLVARVNSYNPAEVRCISKASGKLKSMYVYHLYEEISLNIRSDIRFKSRLETLH